MRKKIFFFLYCMIGGLVNAQTVEDYLRMGNQAFENKNYLSAIYYYNKAIGYDKDSSTSVHPYQAIKCNVSASQKKYTSDSLKTDSLKIDLTVLHDTTINTLPDTTQILSDTIQVIQPDKSDTILYNYTLFSLSEYSDSSNVNFQDFMPTPDTIQKKYSDIQDTTLEAPQKTLVTNKVGNYVTARFPYLINNLADAYRLSYDFENAELWYETALINKTIMHHLTRFWYATCLLRNAKYEKAIEEFTKFNEEHPEPESYYYKKAELEINSCDFGKRALKKPKKGVAIEIVDSTINSEGSDFAATYFLNDSSIIFTSANMNSTAIDKGLQKEGLYFCDLYKSEKLNEAWSNPQNLGIVINTGIHEGAPVLSADKKKMYFTRWDNNTCFIYGCNYFNEQWLQPYPLNQNVNLPGFKSMQPAISSEDNILYFVSDRPGGEGKLDIWYSQLDENGNASPAINLGSKINTLEDDVSPFIHNETKTLYFSSSGRIGLGGADIYRSFGSKDVWSDVENLRYPINSSKDDLYFVLSTDQKNGFMTSDRDGCSECQSGSCYNLYSITYLPIVIEISGTVYNKLTNEIMPNSLVTIEDNFGNTEAVVTDDKGHYSTILRQYMNYYLKCKKVRFFGSDAVASTQDIEESTELVQDFYLERIPLGDIEIPGILYDYNKWDLRRESKIILDDLVKFLNVNDNIIIEIGSHTDERGNDNYNLVLSKNRAKSVVDYLIDNGIPKERLTSIGYGETKLLIKGAQSEDDHQANRRTAFRILSEDYNAKKKNKKS